MRDPEAPNGADGHPVKDSLAQTIRARGRGVSGDFVRSSARRVVGGALRAGGGAIHLGRDAVSGAVQAIEEVSGETGSMVRDLVIGAIEGAGQVATVTAPAVKELVAGAVRGSGHTDSDVAEVGRGAIEGAIAGAVSSGIASDEAAASAVAGAVEAMEDAGVPPVETARATMSGVVSGVVAAEGDVAAASRVAAYTLISHGSLRDRDAEEVASVAGEAVEAALLEVEEHASVDIEVAAATAAGAVAAAYEMDQFHGDHVRRSVLDRLMAARGLVAPELAARVADLGERLAEELPQGRAAWRGRAMYRAVRYLLAEGGIDLSASLAYYTVMSFFPLMALVAMAVALFTDPETVGQVLVTLLAHYFPASSELLAQAVNQLFAGTLTMGLVALAGTLLGANGLYMAANRSVNRIFGADAKGVLSTTLTEAALATIVVILFALSMCLTALFQVNIAFDGAMRAWLGGAAIVLVWLMGAAATALPAATTGLLFTLVYRYLPNTRVRWSNAAFGGMVAMVLFEVGKHLFFWLSGMVTQRSVIYGPVAAFVVLLMWAFAAGLIFLYGAALTRAAGELRPALRQL